MFHILANYRNSVTTIGDIEIIFSGTSVQRVERSKYKRIVYNHNMKDIYLKNKIFNVCLEAKSNINKEYFIVNILPTFLY